MLDFNNVRWLIKELSLCLKVFGETQGLDVVSQTQTVELIQLFGKVIGSVKLDSDHKRDELLKKKNKFTEEDIEDIEEEIRKVDKIWLYVREICFVLLKLNPQVASPEILKSLVKIYAYLLVDVQNAQEYEVITSLKFLIDCI